MKHVVDRDNIRLSYTEDFIERGKPNGLDDLDFNIIETELEPNENFVKNKWNGSEWIEGETAEEVLEKLQKQALINETEMYRKRQCDGVSAYAEISAEFRLAKLSGVLTEEQHGSIEDALIPVRNEVLAGQWKSAKQKLELIGNSIGSDLYNRLHTQMTNYINENYNDVLE